MTEKLHDLYLPFTPEELRGHFASAGTDAASLDRYLAYYRRSIKAARDWTAAPPSGTPAQQAQAQRHGLQIQKDERFWVLTTLVNIFRAPDPIQLLAGLLRGCLNSALPMDGLDTWEQALGNADELRLFFEVSLPTTPEYRQERAQHLEKRVLIKHVLDSARKAADSRQALEGATKVDAVLIAPGTGFAVLFEAKVLADISTDVSYDVLRNQLARNIDVMLQPNPRLRYPLTRRLPERTCFVLITPEIFRDHPKSRLYGWLMKDYRDDPAALRRDLPHRKDTDFASVSKRLGWLTWEDIDQVQPGVSPWLAEAPRAERPAGGRS